MYWLGWLLLAALPWNEQGVIHVSASPHAKLHTVPVRAVRMGDGFWAVRQRTNVETSLPTLLQLLEENGIVDNFRRLSGRKKVARRGPLYTDSDLYKWMEAAAYVPGLHATLDKLIEEVLAAQAPDGYLNTYYAPEKRHTEMTRGHELYCLGHLLQAAIAYYRATGKRRLMDGGIRMVDYLLANFGADKKPIMEGHPEIEMALVELYRTTGERRFLEFAGYLLRGDSERKPLAARDYVYLFTGKPFTGRTQMEGHAVRAGYASAGAADYFLETGDAAYAKTLQTLWSDMTAGKMYITGGTGSRAQGEAFGEPYELPNQQAYTESCAAIANMMWNWRMLAATGEERFAGVMERALYNSVNSGMSLNGSLYCYRNPLQLTGNPNDKIRNPWYSTTCCPPNLERVFASLPGYLYSTSKDGVWVHLYHANTLDWRLEDGTGLKLAQATEYPWEGAVKMTVTPATAREFTLHLRVPEWSGTVKISVNGAAAATGQPGTYAAVRRTWKAGDVVEMTLDMRPRLVAASHRVRENMGKIAVERGPLVYCMEQLDQAAGTKLEDLALQSGELKVRKRADMLNGIVALEADAVVLRDPAALYVPAASQMQDSGVRARATLIPYYTFANRETSAMQVWIPYLRR